MARKKKKMTARKTTSKKTTRKKERASRRTYSLAYKRKVLEELDKAPVKGVVMKREKLYAALVTKWRAELSVSTWPSVKKVAAKKRPIKKAARKNGSNGNGKVSVALNVNLDPSVFSGLLEACIKERTDPVSYLEKKVERSLAI
jgi:hypothetical protein